MALGREDNQPQVEMTRFDKISFALKKTIKTYFERPLYYTFYSGLFLGLVGFFVGHRPMFEFYVIMAALVAIEGYRIWKEYQPKEIQP